jgi:hypothetical protein
MTTLPLEKIWDGEQYAAMLNADQQSEDEEIAQDQDEAAVEEELFGLEQKHNKQVEWAEAQGDYERGN